MRCRQRLTLVVALAMTASAGLSADEGWLIERMAIVYDIKQDGTVMTQESIDVDFRGLSKHGIFRDIVYRQRFNETHDREYDIDLDGVTDASGKRHEVDESNDGENRRFKIGDPDRTISGREVYRLTYRLARVMNAFGDHDELYWNATGKWPVTMARADITVRAPSDAIQRVDCFQGFRGSTERCTWRHTSREATFTATRPLLEGEELTVVVSLRKGVVPEPQPQLTLRPRDITRFFDLTSVTQAGFFGGLLLVGGALGATWWRLGRDRRFVAEHQVGAGGRPSDSPEEHLPLFAARPVAVEFEPPDRIRPAQMGLLIDERADTLDVTATIVDLAVRGYLSITELPKQGWFGSKDWQLERLKDRDAALLEYEAIVLAGLFEGGTVRKLSDLKKKFYDDLAKAQTALYKDAVQRRWFPRNPNTVRTIAKVIGAVLIAAGVFLTFFLGMWWGAGLVGLPVIAGGLLTMIFSGAMPRRTALGRAMLHRTLGFAKYMKTAEVQQQAFAERSNIFTAYLPYAVAFKCVDQWARAFKDIDMQAATTGFYAGSTPFTATNFSSTMGGFSSSVGSTMTSTPGGSGGSGSSGGSSGGGGGGGGGGSW